MIIISTIITSTTTTIIITGAPSRQIFSVVLNPVQWLSSIPNYYYS